MSAMIMVVLLARTAARAVLQRDAHRVAEQQAERLQRSGFAPQSGWAKTKIRILQQNSRERKRKGSVFLKRYRQRPKPHLPLENERDCVTSPECAHGQECRRPPERRPPERAERSRPSARDACRRASALRRGNPRGAGDRRRGGVGASRRRPEGQVTGPTVRQFPAALRLRKRRRDRGARGGRRVTWRRPPPDLCGAPARAAGCEASGQSPPPPSPAQTTSSTCSSRSKWSRRARRDGTPGAA